MEGQRKLATRSTGTLPAAAPSTQGSSQTGTMLFQAAPPGTSSQRMQSPAVGASPPVSGGGISQQPVSFRGSRGSPTASPGGSAKLPQGGSARRVQTTASFVSDPGGTSGGSATFPSVRVLGGGLEQATNTALSSTPAETPARVTRLISGPRAQQVSLKNSGAYPAASSASHAQNPAQVPKDPAAGLLETIQRIEGLSSVETRKRIDLLGTTLNPRSASQVSLPVTAATDTNLRSASPFRSTTIVPEQQLRSASPVRSMPGVLSAGELLSSTAQSAVVAGEQRLRSVSPMPRVAAVGGAAQVRATSPLPSISTGGAAQVRTTSPMPRMTSGRTAQLRAGSPKPVAAVPEAQLRSASPMRSTPAAAVAHAAPTTFMLSATALTESQRRSVSPMPQADKLLRSTPALSQLRSASPMRSEAPPSPLWNSARVMGNPAAMTEPQLRSAGPSSAGPMQSVPATAESQLRSASPMRSVPPNGEPQLQSAALMGGAVAALEPQLRSASPMRSAQTGGEPQLRSASPGRSAMAVAQPEAQFAKPVAMEQQRLPGSPMPSFQLVGAGAATTSARGPGRGAVPAVPAVDGRPLAVSSIRPSAAGQGVAGAATATPALPATALAAAVVEVSDPLMHTFGGPGAGAATPVGTPIAAGSWSYGGMQSPTDSQAAGRAEAPSVSWGFGVKPDPVGADQQHGRGRQAAISTLAVGEASGGSAPFPVQNIFSQPAGADTNGSIEYESGRPLLSEQVPVRDELTASRVFETVPVGARRSVSPSHSEAWAFQPPASLSSFPSSSPRSTFQPPVVAASMPSSSPRNSLQPPVVAASMPSSTPWNFEIGSSFAGQPDVMGVSAQRQVCSVVTLLSQHRRALSDQDFTDAYTSSGCTGLHVTHRNGDFELKVYGSAEARAAACEELERKLEERTAPASPAHLQAGGYSLHQELFDLRGQLQAAQASHNEAMTQAQVKRQEQEASLQAQATEARWLQAQAATAVPASVPLLQETSQPAAPVQGPATAQLGAPKQDSWGVLPQLVSALETIPDRSGVQLEARAKAQTFKQSQQNGAPTAPAAIVTSQDTLSPRVIAESAVGAVERGAGNDTDTVAVTCAELPIPSQYINLLYEEDLQEIERLTGVEISVEEPEVGSSDPDWKLTVFGSADARTEVHKIVEKTLNERLSASSQPSGSPAEVSDAAAEDMTSAVGVDAATTVDAPQGELERPADDSKADSVFSVPHSEISDTPGKDERVARKVDVPHAQFLEPAVKDKIAAGSIDVPHAHVFPKPDNEDDAARAVEAARAADAARAIDGENISTSRKALPCTVLPIPADQMNLLFNEDLWQIRKITGCQAYVSEPANPGDGGIWEIRLYGKTQNRDHARVIVEDTLKDRLSAREGVTPQGYAFEAPAAKRVSFADNESSAATDSELDKTIDVGVSFPLGTIMETPKEESDGSKTAADIEDAGKSQEDSAQKKLVPCTVLPITLEYLQMLSNLDKIQEQTGCQIQISEPDPQGSNAGWQLSLFGSAEARQEAHHAIEDALTAAVAESANSDEFAQG